MLIVKSLPTYLNPDSVYTQVSECGAVYTVLREDFSEQTVTKNGKEVIKKAVKCPVCDNWISLKQAEDNRSSWSLPFHIRWPLLAKLFRLNKPKLPRAKALPNKRQD